MFQLINLLAKTYPMHHRIEVMLLQRFLSVGLNDTLREWHQKVPEEVGTFAWNLRRHIVDAAH